MINLRLYYVYILKNMDNRKKKDYTKGVKGREKIKEKNLER